MTGVPPTSAPTTAGPASTAPRDRIHLLAWVAVLLTPAVLLVPAGFAALRGYSGEAELVAAAESAFVRADVSGPVARSAALADLTAVWQEFHLVKAGVAGLLVLALVGLGSRVLRRMEAAGAGRRRWLLLTAHAGVVVWLLWALTVLLANLQGTVAPFASVASLLPGGRATGELGGVLDRLAASVEAGAPSAGGGVAGELLGDFTLYHAVFALLAAMTGVVLTAVALRSLRWRLRGPGRARPSGWSVQTTLFGVAGGVFLLLAVANTSTWLRPVPALVASLGGS